MRHFAQLFENCISVKPYSDGNCKRFAERIHLEFDIIAQKLAANRQVESFRFTLAEDVSKWRLRKLIFTDSVYYEVSRTMHWLWL